MPQDQTHMPLRVISLALALGVAWGIAVFLLGMAAWLFGWGVGLVGALASLYLGYGPSLVGAIAGAVWAFADGFILGAMIAWFYNRFLPFRQRPGN